MYIVHLDDHRHILGKVGIFQSYQYLSQSLRLPWGDIWQIGNDNFILIKEMSV